jgi:hypothetical protein
VGKLRKALQDGPFRLTSLLLLNCFTQTYDSHHLTQKERLPTNGGKESALKKAKIRMEVISKRKGQNDSTISRDAFPPRLHGPMVVEQLKWNQNGKNERNFSA